MKKRIAIIAGAGPAGLTAAIELLDKTDIKPIIIEADSQVGGISKTIRHNNGYYLDIGGHRFFSKSQIVLDWWERFLPMQSIESQTEKNILPFNRRKGDKKAPDPEFEDAVMLLRRRKSSIVHAGQLLDYPLRINVKNFTSLGFIKSSRILYSYFSTKFHQIRPEKSLEDFLINRFGHELYETFFKSYTEKVWGIPAKQISSEWGKQRIKHLNLGKAVMDSFLRLLTHLGYRRNNQPETSLIESFLYPKYGPGQLWETVANEVVQRGGIIHLNTKVTGIKTAKAYARSIQVEDDNKNISHFQCDYFLSSMPIPDLVKAITDHPKQIEVLSNSLKFRDFLTVGLCIPELNIKDHSSKNTWFYVNDDQVKLGRIQLFNNWSPYMVKDPSKWWIGLEYFLSCQDALWNSEDSAVIRFAMGELKKIGMIKTLHYENAIVVRMPKAYPVYDEAYLSFPKIRDYLSTWKNIYPIGRNGMHRYNNQDHSMLAAMKAVELIRSNTSDKTELWKAGNDPHYHEEQHED